MWYESFNSESGQYEPLDFVQVKPSAVLTATIQGLEAGSKYKIYVDAVNEVGPSEESDAIEAQTEPPIDSAVPKVPTGLVAAEEKQTQVALSWIAPNDQGSPIHHYEIEIINEQTNAKTVEEHVLSATELLIEGLEPESVYNLKVAAVNANGRGDFSASVFVSTIANAVPDIIETPSLEQVGDNLVVSWTAPWDGNSPITAYRVLFARPSPSESSTQYDKCRPQTETSCTFNMVEFIEEFGLAGGDSISAQVKAFNGLGSSENSDSSEAIVLPMAEEIASDIVFEDISAEGLTLSFSPNDGITQYTTHVDKIEDDGTITPVASIVTNVDVEDTRRRRLAPFFSCPGKTNDDAVSLQIEDLEAGATYAFTVEVAGIITEPIIETLPEADAPRAATNLVYTGTRSSLRVTW